MKYIDVNEKIDVEKVLVQHLKDTQKKLAASDEKLKLSESKRRKIESQLDKIHTEVNNLNQAKPNLLTDIFRVNNQRKNQAAMEIQAQNQEKLKNAQITQSRDKALREMEICPSPAQPKSIFPFEN